MESDISDISDIIARLVAEADPELASRMEYQAEALRESACIDPDSFGRWVDANDVKLLTAAFALRDEDFAVRFPRWRGITAAQRRKFLADLDAHFEKCRHCALKRGYDLELDARIKKACQRNSEFLLRLLREEEAQSSEEGEHLSLSFEPAI
ncbi:MAG TPA: hypothetical protein VN282_09920 [Pyrinomonadaceae bacterium]|nr:hypothetical protein [Pyrinomonadaceae bacterium]